MELADRNDSWRATPMQAVALGRWWLGPFAPRSARRNGAPLAPSPATRPIRVGVFVDLEWTPKAGGHVKCWERFAEAAAARDDVDLSVHFFGATEAVHPVAPNVRYITLPPLLGTSSLPFLTGLPDHTDLAPFHVRLLRYLKEYDVVHTTGAFFSLSRTAGRYARRHGVPLVSSIHTDVPKYTRVFSTALIERIARWTWLRRLLLERLAIPEFAGRWMERSLERHLAGCDWALVPNGDGAPTRGARGLRVSRLRRGVDLDAFHPRLRDRERLREAFGIPPDRFVVLYVGRLDEAKSVVLIARAARHLLQRGRKLQVLLVGKGAQEDELRRILGDAAVLPGMLPQASLPWIYASSDLFAFPSRTEVFPNVVLEARASGLPVLLAASGGPVELLEEDERGPQTVGEMTAVAWADAIARSMDDPERQRAAGERARRVMERQWPSWSQVLERDLLPVWRAVALKRRTESAVEPASSGPR